MGKQYKIMEKSYSGFESLNDMIEDMSESHGALFEGFDVVEPDPEFQGTLTVIVTYEK